MYRVLNLTMNNPAKPIMAGGATDNGRITATFFYLDINRDLLEIE